MFKRKTIKLFLILGVILFSLVGVVGCSNPTGSDNVNATYIEMSYPEDAVDNEFTLVNNHLDLLILLKNNAPEKYNESFFETKSLLIFKITEPSGGNKSEIESYEIIDKTLDKVLVMNYRRIGKRVLKEFKEYVENATEQAFYDLLKNKD